MTNPKVVQTTSNLHDLVIKTRPMITKRVFNNPAAFDATNDVFNRDPRGGDDSIDEPL